MPWWAAIIVTAILMVSLLAVASLAAVIQARAWGVPFVEGLRRIALDPFDMALEEAIACALALAVGLRWAGDGSVGARLSIRPVSYAVAVLALVAGLALQFPLAEAENVLRELWPITVQQQLRMQRLFEPEGLWGGISLVLAVVVVAPVGEELVFRGLMLPALERRYGTWFALIASALMFGTAHLGGAHPLVAVAGPALLAGLLLGAVLVRTRSVVPGIAMHAGINAVPVLLPSRVISIPGLNTVSEHVYHLPAPLLLSSTLVAVAALMGLISLSDREGP